MVEFDRKGNEVFSHANQQFNVVRAKKLRNGEVVMVVNAGNVGIFTHMDAKNKVIKTFNINAVNSLFGSMECCRRRHSCARHAAPARRRIRQGRQGAQELQQRAVALGALRLPNGNTLVTCQNQAA